MVGLPDDLSHRRSKREEAEREKGRSVKKRLNGGKEEEWGGRGRQCTGEDRGRKERRKEGRENGRKWVGRKGKRRRAGEEK